MRGGVADDLKKALADVPLRVWALYNDCEEGPTYYLARTKSNCVLDNTVPVFTSVVFDDEPECTYDNIPTVSILSDKIRVSSEFKRSGQVYGGNFRKARLARTAPVWASKWVNAEPLMSSADLLAQLEFFKANSRLSELEFIKAKLYFPYDIDSFFSGLH